MIAFLLRRWIAASILLLVAAAAPSIRPAGPPSIKNSDPLALAPNKSTRVSFSGENLDHVTGLWTSFPARVELLETNQPARAQFSIAVPHDLPTGIGAVRIATTQGISRPFFLAIDTLPLLTASHTNHSMATAQLCALPCAIEGELEPLVPSYYQIHVEKGQQLAIEVAAARLGFTVDPVLRLLDDHSQEIAFCDEGEGIAPDAWLTYTFPTRGRFFIELHDSNPDGPSKRRYRLRLGDFPLVNFTMPFGLPEGAVTAVRFHGPAVQGLQPLFVAPSGTLPFQRLAPSFHNSAGAGSAVLLLSHAPEIIDTEPNDTPETAQRVSWPSAINGLFAKPHDRDCFSFEVRAGDRLQFSGKTRRLGSPCDLTFRICDTNNSVIAESKPGETDGDTVVCRFEKSGRHLLEIRELSGASGPNLGYRIELTPFQPGFTLIADTNTLLALPGANATLKITAQRHEYDGPIQLDAVTSTRLFSLSNTVIPAKKNEVQLQFAIPADCPPGRWTEFRIRGSVISTNNTFSTWASTMPALHTLFPLIAIPTDEFDGSIALGVTDSVPPASSRKPKSATGL